MSIDPWTRARQMALELRQVITTPMSGGRGRTYTFKSRPALGMRI
jgi:hypothetical protein